MKETLGIFSIDVILLSLLIMILANIKGWRYENDASTKKFSGLVFFQCFSLIGESLFNISLCYTNEAFIKISTFIMFGFNYSLIVFFFRYLLALTGVKVKKYNILIHVVEGIYTVCILAFFVNIFTGWLVDFTNLDTGHTIAFECFRFFPVLLVIVCTVLIIGSKKRSFKFQLTIANYAIFPCVALLFEFLSKFFFMNVGTSVAIILIYINIQSEIRKKLIQNENILMQQKMAIMLSQIQPHFLYNSLSAISMLCDSEPEKVKEYISDFSKYLRGNLDSLKLNSCVSFEKEMEHVNLYLKFEKLRFEEKLNVEYDLKAVNFKVPALSIQPLVENAVAHGICKKDEGGTVKISSEETKKSYIIKIEDDGVGFDVSAINLTEENKGKVGLVNINKRLTSMCYAKLQIESQIGRGTVVTVKIPK